jgi:hypothetical protein
MIMLTRFLSLRKKQSQIKTCLNWKFIALLTVISSILDHRDTKIIKTVVSWILKAEISSIIRMG